jgi:hypothetical protein
MESLDVLEFKTIKLNSLTTNQPPPEPIAPPLSQVEELKPILHRNKKYLNLLSPRRQTRPKVKGSGTPSPKASDGRPLKPNAILKKQRKIQHRRGARAGRSPHDQELARERTSYNKENQEKNTEARQVKEDLKYISPAILNLAKDLDSTIDALIQDCLNPKPQSHASALDASQTQIINMGSDVTNADHSRSLDVETVLKVSANQRVEVDKEETRVLTDDDLRAATIDGTVPTVIVDSGASSTCVKPADQQMHTSECGDYSWKGAPFTATGEDSNKLFSMALGHRAPGEEVVDLHLPLRRKSRRGHTVRGITNSLQSLNSAVLDGYIPIFDGQHVHFYDSRNTKITVSRAAVLKGYYVPHEGLWRIPLVYNNRPIEDEKEETIA